MVEDITLSGSHCSTSRGRCCRGCRCSQSEAAHWASQTFRQNMLWKVFAKGLSCRVINDFCISTNRDMVRYPAVPGWEVRYPATGLSSEKRNVC